MENVSESIVWTAVNCTHEAPDDPPDGELVEAEVDVHVSLMIEPESTLAVLQ
jgi:hypothetical protein